MSNEKGYTVTEALARPLTFPANITFNTKDMDKRTDMDILNEMQGPTIVLSADNAKRP